MSDTEQVFLMLSDSTKKKFKLQEPHDLDKFSMNTILSLEIIEQLRELNRGFSSLYDEIWDMNQRRD